MELCECDISLKKVRAYRDSTELLLFIEPKVKQKPPTTDTIQCWGIKFTPLSEKEKSSLRVLSPQLTMLHVGWFNSELLEKTKSSTHATDPVKPLSLPPPERRTDLKGSETEDQPQSSLLTKSMQEELIAAIHSEKIQCGDQIPVSLDEIKRSLAITDTLSQMVDRWGENVSKSSEDAQVHNQEEPSFVEHNENSADIGNKETLYLYFQTGHFDPNLSTMNLPKALHGGWIDSFPPQSLSDDEQSLSTSPNSPEGVWIRLLLESSYWTPAVVLSLHGDMGRLSVNAHLNHLGIYQLLTQSSTSKTLQQTIQDHDIPFEWIDDFYHGQIGDFGQVVQSRQNVIPLSQLMTQSDESLGPSVCFESLLLMSRSLRDLEGELALVNSMKKLKISDTQPNIDQTLGYFTDFIQFKYPPALTVGDEKALSGQRHIRLCLPKLEPFLEKLLMYTLGDQVIWELILEGVSEVISPQKEYGHLLSFDLGRTSEILAKRLDQGLSFSSRLSYACRIGVLTTDGGTLLDELELPTLGEGALKNLALTIDTISPPKEVNL